MKTIRTLIPVKEGVALSTTFVKGFPCGVRLLPASAQTKQSIAFDMAIDDRIPTNLPEPCTFYLLRAGKMYPDIIETGAYLGRVDDILVFGSCFA